MATTTVPARRPPGRRTTTPVPAAPTLARRFRALADETRLEIVGLLRGGEQCVCDLTSALDVQQSLLSFHLKTLKESGLVTDRREGRWVYYALDPAAVEALEGELRALRTASRRRLPTIGAPCCD